MQHKEQFITRSNQQVGYLLYYPPSYAPETGDRWPLLVFLHGLSKRGDDLERVKIGDIPKMLDDGQDFPFVIVSPQCPAGSWWPYEVRAVKELIDHIIAALPIDPDRVYLTGASMGGYGTWALATLHPELFAAIAPVSGGGVPLLAGQLKDVPVWAFHGGEDDVIPLSETQVMVDALKANGADVRLTIFPDCGHDTPAYEVTELYEWLLSHKRT
jgi:predicted peptidase